MDKENTIEDYVHKSEELNDVDIAGSVDEFDATDRRYNAVLKTNDWTEESKLSDRMEELLPMRRNMSVYNNAKYVTHSKVYNMSEPECRVNTSFDTIMILRMFRPVFGFPVKINDTFRTLMFPSTQDSISSVMELCDILCRSNSGWVFPSLQLSHNGKDDAKWNTVCDCYKELPIHAFTVHAFNEANTLPSSSVIWTMMYDTQADMRRRPGVYGIIHDNSMIDVRPYESVDEGTEIARDIDRRKTMPEWKNFVSANFTPSSLEAGRLRSLSYLVNVRMITAHSISFVRHVSHIIANRRGDSSEYTFFFSGIIVRISKQTADEIIRLWLELRGIDMPSLHVFRNKKVISLSVSSGCLMRPVCEPRDYLNAPASSYRWIDSLFFNTDMKYDILGHEFLISPSYWTICSTFAATYPFSSYDTQPRPILGCTMAVQAICKPRAELSSSVAPINTYLPILRTPVMQHIIEDLSTKKYINIPGVPVMVVFMNMKDNYEDSIVFHERVNTRKIFSHRGVVYHQVPLYEAQLSPGTKVDSNDKEFKWWRPFDVGTVLYDGVNASKSRYIAATMQSDIVRLGDKFATCHGQKFTVSRIVGDNNINLFECCRTGATFRPHCIIASSSIHKRGTIGQIYEAWETFNVVDDYSYEPSYEPRYKIIDPYDHDVSSIRSNTCYILNADGSRVSRNGVDVVADFGIIHLWQLIHLSRDKQHYSSDVTRGINPRKGRLGGGSVRLGEMELQSMCASGMMHSAAEAIDNSDVVVTKCCQLCRRLVVLCDCPDNSPGSIEVLVRSSLVKFDIFRAVAGVNAYIGELREDDIPANVKNNSVSMRPESLKYYV